MDYIVLDTNALIMCISPKSKYRSAWKAFLDGEFTLCVSNEVLEEYSEVLGRNLSPAIADYIIQTIMMRANVLLFDPHFRCNLISEDPDDNKFVDCAFAANAKYIVTEDHHFNVLKRISFPKINIIGIDDFCRELSNAVTQ